jgi:hypothetical protein
LIRASVATRSLARERAAFERQLQLPFHRVRRQLLLAPAAISERSEAFGATRSSGLAFEHQVQPAVPSRSTARLQGRAAVIAQLSGVGPKPVRARPNVGLVDPGLGGHSLESAPLSSASYNSCSIAFDGSSCWLRLPSARALVGSGPHGGESATQRGAGFDPRPRWCQSLEWAGLEHQ